MAKYSHYCLGTAETHGKEESEFRSSHLKWSMPSHYHFDAFMQRGVSGNIIDISLNFKLKGIMPQNLQEPILQRIVRLLADGNSQRKVAKMLVVSQRCMSKILPCNWKTGRPHQKQRGGLMKISTPREDRQLLQMVRTSHFISAPRPQMQTIRWFGRPMPVQTI